MLELWFTTGFFYFSHTYDVTNSVEKNLSNENFGKIATNQTSSRHNQRFWYNECFMHEFIVNTAWDWVDVFVCGFFDAKNTF